MIVSSVIVAGSRMKRVLLFVRTEMVREQGMNLEPVRVRVIVPSVFVSLVPVSGSGMKKREEESRSSLLPSKVQLVEWNQRPAEREVSESATSEGREVIVKEESVQRMLRLREG